MPKTGFVHCIDGFAFGNSWDMQQGDWDQLRGLIQGVTTGLSFHPLAAPLAFLIPPGPPISNLILGQIVTDQIVRNVNPGTIGMCGGMTFAAADYYARSWLPPRGEFANGPSPRNPGWAGAEESTLRKYIWSRLLDSLCGNVAVNTLIWMGVARNIFPFSTLGGLQWLRDRSRDELPRIKASIDRGQPCPIALIGSTPNPLDNHQVLVTGYDDPGVLGTGSVRLYVYDPNAPNAEQTIDFDFSGRRPAAESAASERRGQLLGFFAAQYTPREPPPALTVSGGLAASPASRVNVGEAEQFTMTVRNEGFGDTPQLKLFVAGRAGNANVDPGGEATALRIPMNGTRRLVQRTTVGSPVGFRHYFASTSVEPNASHQAWRLPATGTGNTFTNLTVNDPRVPTVNIRLRADNGQYVCAEGGGGQRIVANRRTASEWETFQLVDRNGARLISGDQCTLRANNGQFVCAEGGGGREVVANRTVNGAWETFTILRADGSSGDITNGQRVALRASNGQFVCAEGGGGREVVANRGAIRAWETFRIEFV
ncbi:MAG TPA: hypothetical protein VGW12_07625 [Pyrinomonadaceae bacterium]|nr:hypothetical protein [Pyrinomonadaceae bacterium]